MQDEATMRALFLVGLFVVVPLFVSWYVKGDPLLNAIPTVGFSDPILSYFSALKLNLFDGGRMLKEGYMKTRPGLFKVATFRRWMVLVSGPELLDDVRRAPDDVLSRTEPRCDVLQSEYTLDLPNDDNFYHSDVIRSKLTRNIATTFKDVYDELINALEDSIPTDEDEWAKVPIVETLQQVICRVTNRVFIGAPLCRNRDYQDLNLTFAVNVVKYGTIISFFPKPLKPILARILSDIPAQIRQEMEFIRPLVEERSAKMEEFGDDWDKPNDMLMWLMSEAKGDERSLRSLARRMLIVNFSAIHSTVNTFTHVLYRLLSHPEHMEPLRQEVETIVAEEGWTKAGVDRMHKIDSFIRETLRIDGQSIIITTRLVLRPFTFSNGVTIPAGTLISLPTRATHNDERNFENPDEFDGFRFAKLCESEGDAVTSRHRVSSMSSQNLAWGLGRHSCPGRLFVVGELKLLLAHLVVTYDLKFEEGKGVPPELRVATLCVPGTSDVMFRKQQK